MSTAILIIGMHRSGTSAATGALRFAGVTLGNEMLEPGQDNPKGYWENARAVAIHEQLLNALDRSWDDVRALPEGWLQGSAAAEAMAQIHSLIEDQFADQALWAIKDPRLCRFVPLWTRVLAQRGIQAVALFVARHPDEVAKSIESRNGWPTPFGKLLWMRYTFEAEAATRTVPRTVLTYDRLLKRPVDALREAMARLGLDVPPRDVVPAEELDAFLDSNDRHHRVQTGRQAGTPMDEILAQAYQALAAPEGGNSDWPAVVTTADRAWSLLAPAMPEIDSIAAVAREWQKRHQAALVEDARHRSDLTAQIRWSEEAMQRQEALQADLAAMREQAQLQMSTASQILDIRESTDAQSRLVTEMSARVARQLDHLSDGWADQIKRVAELHEWIEQTCRDGKKELESLRAQVLELQHANAVLQVRAVDIKVAMDQSAADAALFRNEAQSLREENENLREETHRLQQENQGLRESAHQLLQENHDLVDERQQAVLQLNLVLHSFTWRFTHPLRSAVDWLRRQTFR